MGKSVDFGGRRRNKKKKGINIKCEVDVRIRLYLCNLYMQIQPFFYKKAIIKEVFCEIPFILR